MFKSLREASRGIQNADPGCQSELSIERIPELFGYVFMPKFGVWTAFLLVAEHASLKAAVWLDVDSGGA